MTFAANLALDSRTPQFIVELYMTACSLSYTVAPCAAVDQGDGARCCYSFPTCQDVANFAATPRVFKFCLRDSPLAVTGIGLLPYLKEPVFIPQELDPERSVTKKERLVLTFFDEPLDRNFHWDKLSSLTNTSTAGTFWRRFREIYRNYAERRVVVKHGFVGDVESEYQTIFDGLMADLEITSTGICRINAVNKLKRAKRKIPAKISDTNTVRTGFFLGSGTGNIDVVDASEFTDPATLSANAEVIIEIEGQGIGWTGNDMSGVAIFTNGSTAVTGSGTKFLTECQFLDTIVADSDDAVHGQQISAVASDTGLTLMRPYTGRGGQARAKRKRSDFYKVNSVDVVNNRLNVTGAVWGTVQTGGDSHGVGDKIREVVWFGTDSGTDISTEDALDSLIRVLRLAGIPEADIDVTGIQAQRDLWHSGTSSVKCLRLLTDEDEVDSLIQELSEIGLFSVFVTEAGLVTAKVYAPPLPSDVLPSYDDTTGFLADSMAVPDNDEDSRLTRVSVGFDLIGGKEGDKLGHYHRPMTRLNSDAESANGFGDKKSKSILSKFLFRSETSAAIAAAGRTLARFVGGARTIAFSLELKDSGLKLGDLFIGSTSRIQTVIGANVSKTYQVTKKKRASLGRYDYEALEAFNAHRPAFIGPNSLPSDYDSATAAQKKYAFIGTSTNKVGNAAEDGYYIF